MNFKLVRILAVLFLGVVVNVASSHAQSCPTPSYAPINRAYVKRALSDVTGFLARMRELSYLGSIGQPLVNLGLLTQRAALANEYQAYISEIHVRSTPSGTFLRPRTAHFLNVVLNPSNMGISGTSLLGATQAAAEANSGAANAAVSGALSNLWDCF